MIRPSRPSPHFTWEEVTIRNRVPGVDLPHLTDEMARRVMLTCAMVEIIRADVGEAVHVTSCFRHGDPRQHGAGQAMDIQIRSMSPLQLIARIQRLAASGRLPMLRQVIAESRGSGLTGLMAEGSGRWVHVARLGEVGEPWGSRSTMPWLTSLDGENYATWKSPGVGA